MKENDNKAKLFNFLADKIVCMDTPNVVIMTKVDDAVRNCTINLTGVASCSQEDADTQIFVHTRHATEACNNVTMVKDVVVIAYSVLQSLQEQGLQQLRVGCLWSRTEP